MSDQRIGTELAGYRIESLLGRGGMSVVYVAEDLRLKRKAALKVLAPELAMDETFRERFIAESELAAGLDHPNVIPIFEAGDAGGVLFIAMRYVKSTDLKALIKREGRLQPDRAMSIVGQAASALDAAHAQGLVHRDVKPANILVAEGQGPAGTDHVYLADFGLTKRARQRTGLTRTGQFVGTVDYVAPEQIEGKEIDGRTDEYALACVLYECLAGESPYPKDDETAVLIAHLMDPVPSIRSVRPELPPALDDVIRAGMAKQKESRFPDCVSLVRAADDALGGRPSITQYAAPPSAAGTFDTGPPVGAVGGAVQAGPPPTFTAPPAFSAPSPSPGVPAPAPGTFRPADDEPPPRRRSGRRPWTTALVAALAAAVVAAVLVVVLSRISGGGGDGGPSGSAASSRGVAPGTVIMSDDFSNDSGRWDQFDQANVRELVSSDGTYLQEIKQQADPPVFAAGFPHTRAVAKLGDVSVAAQARVVQSQGVRNAYGVGCRTEGSTRSYYFIITATGRWAIEKSDGVHQPALAHGTSPLIVRGGDVNTIQGACVGGAGGSGVTLTLSVNGQVVKRFVDTPESDVQDDPPGVFATGTVGLLSIGNKGLEVEFDHFVVKAAG
ncbi:MAG: serine/threonine-protein kinase [Actinomycetota bacterium]